MAISTSTNQNEMTFAVMSGTSMSPPNLSGIAALYQEETPSLVACGNQISDHHNFRHLGPWWDGMNKSKMLGFSKWALAKWNPRKQSMQIYCMTWMWTITYLIIAAWDTLTGKWQWSLDAVLSAEMSRRLRKCSWTIHQQWCIQMAAFQQSEPGQDGHAQESRWTCPRVSQ